MHDSKGTKPICSACSARPPELLKENYDVYELWKSCLTQWRAAAFGVIGLDYGALFKMADIMEIDLSEDIMSSIQLLESKVLEAQNQKAQLEIDKAKTKNGP